MRELLDGLRFAVVGATGLVGQEMLKILSENGVKQKNVRAFASAASAGRQLPYGTKGAHLLVEDTDEADFSGFDVALLAVEAEISALLSLRLAVLGVLVVDNSSRWRMDPKVPLVVPEVNAERIADFRQLGIIANPNCATIQMLVALKPLHDAFYARKVVACTYQSVSGAGLAGTRALEHELAGGFSHEPFVAPIAGNVIPLIGSLPDKYGQTSEEEKMMAESRKILHSGLKVSATCVRVPVVTGHGVAVHVLFDQRVDMVRVLELLAAAPGVRLGETLEHATPSILGASDDVVVARIRRDPGMHKHKGLAFWCVANNVRKGAALNAVQIVAEWRKQGFGPK